MQCSSQKSAIDIDKRRTELLELSSYIQSIDNDVTMILQSLQWDRKHLIETTPMTSCKYDQNHRVPPDKLEYHEKECYLRHLGYTKEDLLLPEPLDANANTLVTLNKNDIENIIDYAAKIDPTFKKGRGPGPSQPLSLERLQHAYSADERRALHDAAVSAAPSCHDLNELALLGGDGDTQPSKRKTRAEILVELRDMRRRRTKYRGAAKSRNYSDVLRGVIATQMEHYTETQTANTKHTSQNNHSKSKTRDFGAVHIKKEPIDQDTLEYSEKETTWISNEHDRRRDKSRDKTRHRDDRHETRPSDRSRDKYKEREKAYDDYKTDRDDRRHKHERDRYSSSSKERSRDKQDYRSSGRYRDDSSRNYREYRDDWGRKDYKDKSKNSDVKYKHEEAHGKSHREEHKRYYEQGDYYEVSKRRIKQEKD